MSGGGRASGRAGGSSAKVGSRPFSAAELNITGTEKQVSYARDIVQGAFDIMDSNIKRQKDLAKSAKTDSAKKTYREGVKDWKAFKDEMTETYRKNASIPLPASGIISTKYRFQDGVLKDFETWKKRKK